MRAVVRAGVRKHPSLWTCYNDLGDGRTQADAQTKVVQAAFRGKRTAPDEVQFRAVRVVEMPKSGSRSRTRVVVDFEYDEIVP